MSSSAEDVAIAAGFITFFIAGAVAIVAFILGTALEDHLRRTAAVCYAVMTVALVICVAGFAVACCVGIYSDTGSMT